MKSLPKISVVTPSYNQGEFIAQTIESVLCQNYQNFEHIIMDGGSTDDTLSVVARYPHLTVISEQDRGQTHALNKAFSRATGDIIAWINSDDWYAPNVFHEVVQALQSHPVVMGECAITDRNGTVTDISRNVEHHWYDLLKYWIYQSIPAQPGIFFKRELLDLVKRRDGSYLDEDLEYCMDWDLWLRLSKHAPLSKRIPKIVSYARMYESNKTGAYPEATNREWQRVFQRYANSAVIREKAVTIFCLVKDSIEKVEQLVSEIVAQSTSDVELLCIDISEDGKLARANKKAVASLAQKVSAFTIRYTRPVSVEESTAIAHGINASCSPFVAYVKDGEKLGRDFFEHVRYFFSQDFASLLVSRNEFGLSDVGLLPADASFKSGFSFPSFVIRKIAFQDIGESTPEGLANGSDLLCFRRLLFSSYQKGWRTIVAPQLFSDVAPLSADDQEYISVFGSYVNAAILLDGKNSRPNDPFIQIREEHGFSMTIPHNLYDASERLLKRAPANWASLSGNDPISALEEVTRQHPQFSPGWYLLAKAANLHAMNDTTQKALARFQEHKAQEALL